MGLQSLSPGSWAFVRHASIVCCLKTRWFSARLTSTVGQMLVVAWRGLVQGHSDVAHPVCAFVIYLDPDSVK